jgi:hypothetical protein
MRRPYQLSKIGKEKRKSGSFRFCGLFPARCQQQEMLASCIREGSTNAAGG